MLVTHIPMTSASTSQPPVAPSSSNPEDEVALNDGAGAKTNIALDDKAGAETNIALDDGVTGNASVRMQAPTDCS